MIPQDFFTRVKGQLGEEYPAFLRAMEGPVWKALRRNPLKIEEEDFLRKLPFLGERVGWAPDGYYYPAGVQPGRHPFHQAGLYYIQEPSAMAPAALLADVCAGERILDLCAAPGGKSAQLAAAMEGKGLLVCNEPHPARAKILSGNIERMGVKNALVTNEAPDRLAKRFPAFFDRILVDAPCSGEGMFRKSEEARREWSPGNVARCAARQGEILQEAAKMLRPGGRLVYSTCTFSEEENEGNCARFLEGRPEFTLLAQKSLWPHQVKGEGHFMALLEKKSGLASEEGEDNPLLPVRAAPGFEAFCKEYLRWQEEWRLFAFGEQLYHLPEGCPSLKGLKTLRPGFHLGTVKKNRFEPSHALAMALTPFQVKYSLDLPAGDFSAGEAKPMGAAPAEADAAALRYLSGQTLAAQGEKGWHLITVQGYSLGWGKLSGGVMKNHYPKGLRRG